MNSVPTTPVPPELDPLVPGPASAGEHIRMFELALDAHETASRVIVTPMSAGSSFDHVDQRGNRRD
jgi:hypothetical protein